MTISGMLHASKTHASGFDVNCPQCLKDYGIAGIIRHLKACATQNEADASDSEHAKAVAGEQRRMIAVLQRYCKANSILIGDTYN